MADPFATLQDLADSMQVSLASLNTGTATLLLETATAAVQEAARQRILQVVGDTCSILSTTDSWLDLPQIPVTAVTSVVLDGVTLTLNTDYKVFGNRLWRQWGWQNNMGWSWGWDWNWRPSYAADGTPYTSQAPSLSVITYTHGYAAGAQELQLARGATLSLAKGVYVNPSGVQSESIDDYNVAYTSSRALSAQMELAPHVKGAIRRQYARRAGLVRLG
jgi:hypothetical protein